MSAVYLNNAMASKVEAERQKVLAERDEVIARTPTHGVSIEKMQQEIAQSVHQIQKIIAETNATVQGERTSAAQQQNLEQTTRNLIETIPQIRQTVRHLEAMTAVGWQQEREVAQRIKANLPEIDRLLKELEQTARELDQPRRGQEANMHDSFVGKLGALLRILNPLNNFINSAK